jgi:hypothetical protein
MLYNFIEDYIYVAKSIFFKEVVNHYFYYPHLTTN